jgi:nucleotide-binding universal stress UspA family protein
MNVQHFFRNILVPVDDSRSCFHAKKFASLIASKFKSKVTAVHVTTHECMHPELKAQYRLPPAILHRIEEVYLKSGKKILRKTEDLFREDGIEVDSRLITCEDPAESVIELVKDEGYDLIVIGNRAGHQSQRYALGSVTEKIARHAGCTVFIVKKKTLLEKILVAHDGSKHADRALEYAVQLAKKYRVNLALLHVEDDNLIRVGGPDVLDCLGTVGECILENASKKIQGVSFGKFLKYGNPAETIIKMAQKGNVDLIVVGSRGSSSVKRFLLGSVSDDISMHSRSSVLIVR